MSEIYKKFTNHYEFLFYRSNLRFDCVESGVLQYTICTIM